MADDSLSAADFRNIVHKQIVGAAYDTLADADLDPVYAETLLESAREVCRGDFREGGARVRLHTLRAEGEEWVDAEEAFLGISVRDRETGEEWLSETWWISDLAAADGDPDKIRSVIAALERSIARLRERLEKSEGPAAQAGETGPPSV